MDSRPYPHAFFGKSCLDLSVIYRFYDDEPPGSASVVDRRWPAGLQQFRRLFIYRPESQVDRQFKITENKPGVFVLEGFLFNHSPERIVKPPRACQNLTFQAWLVSHLPAMFRALFGFAFIGNWLLTFPSFVGGVPGHRSRPVRFAGLIRKVKISRLYWRRPDENARFWWRVVSQYRNRVRH